jgi:hypothetical protein
VVLLREVRRAPAFEDVTTPGNSIEQVPMP